MLRQERVVTLAPPSLPLLELEAPLAEEGCDELTSLAPFSTAMKSASRNWGCEGDTAVGRAMPEPEALLLEAEGASTAA